MEGKVREMLIYSRSAKCQRILKIEEKMLNLVNDLEMSGKMIYQDLNYSVLAEITKA